MQKARNDISIFQYSVYCLSKVLDSSGTTPRNDKYASILQNENSFAFFIRKKKFLSIN